jgi:hypothetical protein
MVPRTSAATALQWLSRKSGAGHRGPSAGSQRHFGRGDGRDVARLPAGIVFGAHLVAPHHGGLVREDGRSHSRRTRRGRRHHRGAGVRRRPARADHRELPRKTRGIVGQEMRGVPVVGLGTQTGVRLREDDRHLGSSQIWPGQIRADRGTLVRKNPKLRKSVKYLGVIIDMGLLWIEHTRYVAGKVMAAAHKVRGFAGKTWGTDPRTLREIYNGAIRPVLLYGGGVWGERSSDPRIQRYLRTAQRSFLLGITRAYRTTSNLALEVLAGCVPLHIDAAAIHSRWQASKSNDFEGKVVFAEEPHPAEPERKWEELIEDEKLGTWFWTDASRKEENTAVGVVRMEPGKIVERRGLRLQDSYLTHMAELYALGSAINSVAGPRGT